MPDFFTKDPDDVLDYSGDWSEWLNATSPVDTISTSVWTATSGITIDSETETTTKTTAWVSGGTSGNTYGLTNRITTAGGRTKDHTIYIKVRDR